MKNFSVLGSTLLIAALSSGCLSSVSCESGKHAYNDMYNLQGWVSNVLNHWSTASQFCYNVQWQEPLAADRRLAFDTANEVFTKVANSCADPRAHRVTRCYGKGGPDLSECRSYVLCPTDGYDTAMRLASDLNTVEGTLKEACANLQNGHGGQAYAKFLEANLALNGVNKAGTEILAKAGCNQTVLQR